LHRTSKQADMGKMLSFIIRKSFWDFLDNLLPMFLLNLGLHIILITEAALIFLYLKSGTAMVIVFVCLHLTASVYASVSAAYCRGISNGSSCRMKDFAKNLKETWPTGLIFGLLTVFLIFLFRNILPYYISLNNIYGLIAAVFLGWFLLITLLALQYFFSLSLRTAHTRLKALKAMYQIFFAHPFLSLLLVFFAVLQAVFSVLTAFILPGISGILLFYDNAVRTIARKYTYIAEHPENRKNIPWDELNREEEEKLDERNLLDFFFPFRKK
jgi:hypothetical protein